MEENKQDKDKAFSGKSSFTGSQNKDSSEISSETCSIKSQHKNLWLYEKEFVPKESDKTDLVPSNRVQVERSLPQASMKAKLGTFTRNLNLRLGKDIMEAERPTSDSRFYLSRANSMLVSPVVSTSSTPRRIVQSKSIPQRSLNGQRPFSPEAIETSHKPRKLVKLGARKETSLFEAAKRLDREDYCRIMEFMDALPEADHPRDPAERPLWREQKWKEFEKQFGPPVANLYGEPSEVREVSHSESEDKKRTRGAKLMQKLRDSRLWLSEKKGEYENLKLKDRERKIGVYKPVTELSSGERRKRQEKNTRNKQEHYQPIKTLSTAAQEERRLKSRAKYQKQKKKFDEGKATPRTVTTGI